jgi:hypothetical protein
MGERRNAHKNPIGKSEKKRAPVKSRQRREDIINTGLIEI